jgi:hypothetical protein
MIFVVFGRLRPYKEESSPAPVFSSGVAMNKKTTEHILLYLTQTYCCRVGDNIFHLNNNRVRQSEENKVGLDIENFFACKVTVKISGFTHSCLSWMQAERSGSSDILLLLNRLNN